MDVKNVVIVNDFNYIQGGASTVAIQTAVLLQKAGKKVYFFSAVNHAEENQVGIEYITTNQKEALKEKNKLKGIINGIYNFKAKKQFKQLLSQLNPKDTIIHVHGWTKALSSSVIDITYKMKFKVVFTLHDYFTACPNGGFFNYSDNTICELKPLSTACLKCKCDSRNSFFKLYRILRSFVQNKIVKLPQKMEYAVGISNLSMHILKPYLNPNIQMEKIYNPVDFNESQEKIDFKKNQYFLYVGRLSKEKGVDIFCKAVTELGEQGIVVGDGDEKARLEKTYPNIEFTGWKNQEEVKQYMKRAKCLIFPSLWYETAGLTILEAQSFGIPSLVSNTCAGCEFVEKEFTFNNRNLEELKEKMQHICQTKNEISFRNDYSNEKYIKNLLAFFKNI